MRVIGIDPGTGRMGWSIIAGTVKKQQLLACGCFETDKKTDPALRLLELQTKLIAIIDEFQPEVLSMEALFFFKNAKTVIQVSEARGMVLTLCAGKQMSIYNYTPLQVKQTITGFGRAEKSQVETMVKSLLGITKPIKPDDAADAVAIGLTHFMFNQTLRS